MQSDRDFMMFLNTRNPQMVELERTRGGDLIKEMFGSAEHRKMVREHNMKKALLYPEYSHRPAKPNLAKRREAKMSPEQLRHVRAVIAKMRNEGKI